MIKGILENEVRNVLLGMYPDSDVSNVKVVRSENFGDYAVNAGFVLSKQLGKSPIVVALELVEKLKEEKSGSQLIEKAEVAGGGFVNITVSFDVILSMLNVLSESLDYGFDFLSDKSINIEFISTNPTGALHLGHGVNAFYGDVLTNVLTYAGAKITREFYINDSRESVQIKELGKTALGLGEQYKTAELEKMMKSMKFDGMSVEEAGFALACKVQEKNKKFIEKKLGVKFDRWYSEDENIRAKNLAEKTLKDLKKRDLVYEKDGALWLKTSEYGDDEDRVLVRSDGTNSYFLADIAYHQDKFKLGHNAIIDVWGADHHGHVKRIHSVGRMLGWPSTGLKDDEQQPIVFITQMVSLKEKGESKKMSKRAGNVILLEDIVDDFGIDVVRWFFLEKSLGTHIDFDVKLARERSHKNPVFYVQYAHARMASIIKKAKELEPDKSSLEDILKETIMTEGKTLSPARNLSIKIAEFEEVLGGVIEDYGVHKVTTYAYQLATELNKFYRDVLIVKDGTYNNGALELITIAKKTLAKTLNLLGISAPDRM